MPFDREKVREAIDCGAWKHSWHLPKDDHGYVRWSSPDTITRCRDILEKKITETVRKLARLQEALDMCNEWLK